MSNQRTTPVEPIDDDDDAGDDLEDLTVTTLLRSGTGAWPIEEAARERVRAHWRSMLLSRRRRRWAAVGALAAALGGVLVLAGTLRRPSPPPAAVPAAPSVATVELIVPQETAAAGVDPAPLRLSDRVATTGSQLTVGDSVETSPRALAALRAGATSIRLDVATRLLLLPERRIRLERGAVYLDTPPGGARRDAFEVLTDAGTVREVGTQFEVRVEAAAVRIRVREGAVELRAPSGATQRVEASQELLAGPRADATTQATASSGPGWEWAARAAPQPPLAGATLADLLSWVSRETGAEVTFVHGEDAKTTKSVILHGPLEGLDPVSAVEVALPTCGLRGRFVDGRLVIDRLP